MNTEEAYKLLGLSNKADSSEVNRVYREKLKEMEQEANLADTAIDRQITLQGLKVLDQSRIVLVSEDSETDTKSTPSVSENHVGVDIKRISILVIIALLVVIGVSLNTGQDQGIAEAEQQSPSFKAAAQSREQAQSQLEQFENYIVENKLPLFKHTENIEKKFQDGVDKERSDQLDEAIVIFDEVKLFYQDLLKSTRKAVDQSKLADELAMSWNEYRKNNNVPNIPQAIQLENLLLESYNYFRAGDVDKASAGYSGAVRLYGELIEKIKPVVEERQKSVLARSRWHVYRNEQQFTGQKIENVDKPYVEAQRLETAGQLFKAIKGYHAANLNYVQAMDQGAELTVKNPWLEKMRSRLVEIEAEKQNEIQSQSVDAQKNLNIIESIERNTQSTQNDVSALTGKDVSKLFVQFNKNKLIGNIHYYIFHNSENWIMQTLVFDHNTLTIIEDNDSGESTTNTISYKVKDGLLHLDDSRIIVKIMSKDNTTEAIHTCWEQNVLSSFNCSGVRLEYLFDNKHAALRFLTNKSYIPIDS